MTDLAAPPPGELTDVPLGDGERIVLRRYSNPGRPALALSHGNGFAIDAYAPFWASLRDTFDLFVFDLRHHGRNAPQDPSKTGIETYADDLDRVYRAIRGAARDAPLYGAFHSLSGISAICHAAGHATGPDRLVLFDPPLQPPQAHPLHELAYGFEMKLADWSAGRPARFASPTELAAAFAKSRSLSGWVEGAHELMARAILRPARGGWVLACPPAVEARNYRDNAAYPSWDTLARIGVPFAIVGADPTHPAGQSPARVTAAFAEAHKAPYRMVAGTTHMLQIEKPEACRDALSDLLR